MPLIQSFPPVDGQTVQAEVLPTAGAAQLDKIYQYVGTTTPQYVNGYYYKCIYNNPNYEWVNVLVQPEANPDPSVILTGIILANGWNNNAQTVTVNDFDPSAPGTIGLLNTVTGEQYAAAANAGLRVTAIANNSVTFSCEEVPEIDIPFGVLIPGTTVNGGDGTTDYTYLDNKPQIANVTLQGNKSLADLGIAGASDVETALGTKVDKVAGKGLSTNDYTNEDKTIVDGISTALADKVDKVAGKGLSTNDYTNEDKAIVGGVTSALAGKQDTISDLATIRSGASAGASAVQPSATEGLLKNDGTVDTVAKASQAAVNAILDGTNIDSFGDVETALANKVDKVEGKGLSTNDYSDTEKGKVADNAGAIEAIVNEYGCCNVFAIDNPISLSNVSVANNGIVNTDTDSKTVFNCWVATFNSSGQQIQGIFNQNIDSTGHKVFDITIPNNSYYSLQLRHNGSVRDLAINVPAVPAGNYKLSFDIVGYNPSTVGGLEITNIMLYDARLKPTGYVPYAMTNRELTENVRGLNNNLDILNNMIYSNHKVKFSIIEGNQSYSIIPNATNIFESFRNTILCWYAGQEGTTHVFTIWSGQNVGWSSSLTVNNILNSDSVTATVDNDGNIILNIGNWGQGVCIGL